MTCIFVRLDLVVIGVVSMLSVGLVLLPLAMSFQDRGQDMLYRALFDFGAMRMQMGLLAVMQPRSPWPFNDRIRCRSF